MRLQRSRRRRVSLCCCLVSTVAAVATVLSLNTPCVGANASFRPTGIAAAAKEREQQLHDSLSFRSSSRLATAAAALSAKDANKNSVRSTQSERLLLLLEDDEDDDDTGDFQDRLFAEEMRSQGLTESSAGAGIQFLVASAVAAFVLVTASHLITSGAALAMWNDISSSYGSLFNVFWMPALLFRFDGNGLRQAVSAMRKPDAWVALIPLAFGTLKKMIVAELWTRFWGTVFTQVRRVLVPSLRSNDDRKVRTLVPEWFKLPKWIGNGCKFVVSSVRRGVETAVKKTTQPRLHSSIVTVSSFVLVVLRNALFGESSTDFKDIAEVSDLE